ncbi:DUF4381 domain-containing protein [Gammaproteobacteria bacterium]|nr:DUF4381 domain-containing protein [Gammaproteobacteria bacterium]
MDSEELLAQLADIRLPGEISWWPPAPGWWILAALALVSGIFAWRAYVRARDTKLLLSFALAEIELCIENYNQQTAGNDPMAGLNLLNATNTVLRRVALFHNPHTTIASLSGDDWAQFLLFSSTSAAHLFTDSLREGFSSGRFQRELAVDAETLHAFAIGWIRDQYSRAGDTQLPVGTAKVSPAATEANA